MQQDTIVLQKIMMEVIRIIDELKNHNTINNSKEHQEYAVYNYTYINNDNLNPAAGANANGLGSASARRP